MHRTTLICFAALLVVLPQTFAAQTSSSRIERVNFLGREYVRLNDWARANSLQLRIVNSGKGLSLTNASHRFLFTADQREAEMDGVKIWLSFPVATRGGNGYLSSFDLRATIQPVLFPAKLRSGKIKTIALDPGHGGKDMGNHNGAAQEKKYTLLLAQELREQLTRAGYKVFLTRTTDAFVDKAERPAIAKKRGADLFLSLHLNATGSGRDEAKGVETYCFTPSGASSTNDRGEGTETRASKGNRNDDQNMTLAFQLQKSLAKSLPTEDRGVRRARFQVLRDAEMPAALIETGFLSHPSEGRKLIDPAYRRQIAKAIVSGIANYRKVVEDKQ